jgi:hypothetical protein
MHSARDGGSYNSLPIPMRDGSGIGVGAPEFGQRRGFYGTILYDF